MSAHEATAARAQPWHLDRAIRTARISEREWRYIDTGGLGPALVMLPGSVGTCEMFFKQIAALAPAIRVVAVSYPAEPDPVRLADGLAGLMDAIGLETASILGSSFGGYWAQFVALRHAARVGYLFLGNIFVSPEKLFANPLFAPDLVRAKSAADLQAMWRDRVAQAPDGELKRIQSDMLAGRQSADNLRARFVGVIDATLCPPLPIPHQRIVVIDCADDPIIPPAARQDVHARYAGAEIHTLSRGGHYPHILNPQAYDDIIRRRLNAQ
jgi:maspardin